MSDAFVGLLVIIRKCMVQTAKPATNSFRYPHNKHKRRTFMPSEAFEPAIPTIKRPHTHALDRVANGIIRVMPGSNLGSEMCYPN
jgi:hypothetical protein